jgi:hypothetical protein
MNSTDISKHLAQHRLRTRRLTRFATICDGKKYSSPRTTTKTVWAPDTPVRVMEKRWVPGGVLGSAPVAIIIVNYGQFELQQASTRASHSNSTPPRNTAGRRAPREASSGVGK